MKTWALGEGLLYAILIFIAAGSLVGPCEAEAWEFEFECEQPPDPVCEELRVALVGDSLMSNPDLAGYLHDRFLQFDWYDWDGLWNREKDEVYWSGADVQVKTFAREGDGVSGVLEQVWEALGSFHPTHVVIYGGINDCVMYGHTPEQNAHYVIQALDAMAWRVRDSGAIPVLVKHHPWKGSWRNKKNKGWECSALVNEWINGEDLMTAGAWIVDTGGHGKCPSDPPDACLCYEDECEDDWPVLDPSIDAGDGLHLNWMGQCLLAQSIQQQVKWWVDH